VLGDLQREVGDLLEQLGDRPSGGRYPLRPPPREASLPDLSTGGGRAS
jgi:hypothetical protein